MQRTPSCPGTNFYNILNIYEAYRMHDSTPARRVIVTCRGVLLVGADMELEQKADSARHSYVNCR